MDSETEKLWRSLGIDPEFLTESAAWLGAVRGMHGNALRHFEVAASLLRFSRQDYKLGGAAFFHTVLGLEKALRMHYNSTSRSLQELLCNALGDHLITDIVFENTPAFTQEFDRIIQRLIPSRPNDRAALLVELIPGLRNEYLHGEYLL